LSLLKARSQTSFLVFQTRYCGIHFGNQETVLIFFLDHQTTSRVSIGSSAGDLVAKQRKRDPFPVEVDRVENAGVNEVAWSSPWVKGVHSRVREKKTQSSQ